MEKKEQYDPEKQNPDIEKNSSAKRVSDEREIPTGEIFPAGSLTDQPEIVAPVHTMDLDMEGKLSSAMQEAIVQKATQEAVGSKQNGWRTGEIAAIAPEQTDSTSATPPERRGEGTRSAAEDDRKNRETDRTEQKTEKKTEAGTEQTTKKKTDNRAGKKNNRKKSGGKKEGFSSVIRQAFSLKLDEESDEEILEDEPDLGKTNRRRKRKETVPQKKQAGQMEPAAEQANGTENIKDSRTEKSGRTKVRRTSGGLTQKLRELYRKQEEETFAGDPEKGEKKWRLFHYLFLYGKVVLIVVAAVLAVYLCVHFWQYQSYRFILEKQQEDTLSVSYARFGNAFLRYGREGATLYDLQGQEKWTTNYVMEEPELVCSTGAAAVYDRSGTEISVMNSSGALGTFSTDYPIRTACVDVSGRVAAILEAPDTTWIQYYEPSGELIASVRTAIDSPGYPLQLSLSDNGVLLAVSYLHFRDGVQTCTVEFYNFDTMGQNRMDNEIASFSYEGTMIPEVQFMGNSACVAYTDKGFVLYQGARIPEEKETVTVDTDIVSVFHDAEHIGLILQTTDPDIFQMQVYDRNGDKVLDREIDFPYEEVEIVGNEIDLYNGSRICVYNLQGVKKFDGEYETSVKDIVSVGEFRFLIVEENSLEMIKLR